MSSTDDYFIRASDLSNQQFIKSGAFGDVYKGYYFEKAVAIKHIKIPEGSDKERALKALQLEVDVLRNARHPNVVLFMGANFTEQMPFIVTEYATHGNLEEVLKKGGLDQATKLKFAIDVALGMMYLHGRKPKIAHLDLKPDNLLVFSERTLKICDFGLSRPLGPEDATSTMGGRGSPHYMAPECIDVNGGGDLRSSLSHKSDVFSFAMVLFRMFAGQHPFRGLLHEGRAADWLHVFMARQNKPHWRPAIPNDPNVHPGIWAIAQQCWHADPTCRPPFETILTSLREIHQQVSPAAALLGRNSMVAPSPAIHQQPSTALSPSNNLLRPPSAHTPPHPLLPRADAPIHASAGSSSSTASSTPSFVSLPLGSQPSNNPPAAAAAPPLSPFFTPPTSSAPSPPHRTGTGSAAAAATAYSSAPSAELISTISSLTAPATPPLASLRDRYSAIPTAEFDRLANLFIKCDVYYTGCVTSANLQAELRAQAFPTPTTTNLAARLRNRAIVLGSDELLSLDNFLHHAHATCLALDAAPPAAPAPRNAPHSAASPASPALASMPSATLSAYGGRYPYLPEDYIAELKCAFARLDVNGDGKLLREEILGYAAGRGAEESGDFASKLLQQLQENRLVTYFTVDQLLESANKAAYEFFHTGDSSSAATLPFPLASSHLSGSLASAPTGPDGGSGSPGDGGGGGSFDLAYMRNSLDRGGAAGGPPMLQDLEGRYRGRLSRDEICDWWRYFCELDSQRDGVLTRTEVMAAHWTDANGNQVMEENEIDAAAAPLLRLLDTAHHPVSFPVFIAWAADTRQPGPSRALRFRDVRHSADQSPFGQAHAPFGATLVRGGGVPSFGRTGTDKLVFEQLRDILGSEPSSVLSDDTDSFHDRDDHEPDTDDSTSIDGVPDGEDEDEFGDAGVNGAGVGIAGGRTGSGSGVHQRAGSGGAAAARAASAPEAVPASTRLPGEAPGAPASLRRNGGASATASAPVPGHSAALRRGGAAAPAPVQHPPNLVDLQARFRVSINTILAYWSLFRKVDVNGDGQADIKELEAALHQKDLQALFVSLMYMFQHSEGRPLAFEEFLALALEAPRDAPGPTGKLDVETLAGMSSKQLLQAFLKRMKKKLLG